MRSKINREKVIELYKEGKTDSEIAKLLGHSVNGIRYIRKDILDFPNITKSYPLTLVQEEIIIGTLLGDAYVGYIHKYCKYPKYQVTHAITQKEYTLTIYKELQSIMTDSIIYRENGEKIFNNKTYSCKGTISIYSHNCPSLAIYRDMFYPNGKKIIPVEFIKERFSPRSLAYWYMDDGSKDRNSNSYIINSQCFERENLQLFIDYLEGKFNILFNIKKDNSLYLRHCSNDNFKQLILPYITSDMQYKI